MLTKKQTCLTKSIRSIPYSFSFYYSHFSHSRFQWRWTGRVRKLRGNERSLIVEKFPRDRVENEHRGGRGLRGGTFSNDDWQTFITFRSEVKPKANRKTISDNVNLPVHATRGGVSRVCVCVCARGEHRKTREFVRLFEYSAAVGKMGLLGGGARNQTFPGTPGHHVIPILRAQCRKNS